MTPALTYADFALLDRRRAGQYWAYGAVAGQWAWAPGSPGTTPLQPGGSCHISWGDPAAWPPPTYERFARSTDGEWVVLIGYGHTDGRFLRQVVTAEQLSDADGSHPRPLDVTDGAQRYARWRVDERPYRLEAWGHMDWEAARIDFHHRQVWSPPEVMGNRYIAPVPCIHQFEAWADNFGDPGGPLVARIRRDHWLAQGLGPAFVVAEHLTAWRAELRYHWSW
ncbi:MAG: hypothetical protein ACRDRZ_03595 [Pseudonocardiaceae bacterium]